MNLKRIEAITKEINRLIQNTKDPWIGLENKERICQSRRVRINVQKKKRFNYKDSGQIKKKGIYQK